MTSAIAVTEASMLRAKGNEHYKKNEYLEAIKLYREAVEKALSDDPLPYSNLSAALFETGDYAGCIDAARVALSKGTYQAASWKEKLGTRIVNAELHVYAKDGTLTPSRIVPVTSLQATAAYISIKQAYQNNTKDQAWSRIIQDIPSIKPGLTGVPEYPVWANGYAVSLYDPSLAAISTLKPEHFAIAKESMTMTQPIANQINLGFADNRDGRHLYATWLGMCGDRALLRGRKQVNIFTNDVRPQNLARNLVIFKLLQDLSSSQDTKHRSLLSHTMYFTYCNQLMPSATENTMRQTSAQVIEMLEGRSPFPPWLNIAAQYRQSIVLVLRSWQRQNHRYSSKYVQGQVAISCYDDVQHDHLPTLDKLQNMSIDEKLRIEVSVYRRTMALFSSVDFAKKYEPTLATPMALFTTLESAKGREVVKLREYIATSWKVNPTWYANDFEDFGSHVDAVKPAIENIPNDFFLQSPIAPPENAVCFYDFMHEFFSWTAGALRNLAKSMTVTMLIGKIIPKLERARYIADASEWTTT